MRIEEQTKDYFRGTHKGFGIIIERSEDNRFSVRVYDLFIARLITSRGYLAPPYANTIDKAKQVAKFYCGDGQPVQLVTRVRTTAEMLANWSSIKDSLKVKAPEVIGSGIFVEGTYFSKGGKNEWVRLTDKEIENLTVTEQAPISFDWEEMDHPFVMEAARS